MRILWAKANKILPVTSGGDLRSFNLLKQLAASDQLVFFSCYDGVPDHEYETELRKQLPGSICVCTGKKVDSRFARVLDYARRLPQDPPYAVSRFASRIVCESLRRAIEDMHPDVVLCDFLDAAVNLPGRLAVPAVLFQHNVESEIWRRHAEMASNPLKRQLFRLEYAKMLRYEKAAVAKFDRVIAVSEHDRSLMSRWLDVNRIDVVPTGVDLSQFQRCGTSSSSGSPLVVFVGAMDWEPNIDAVEWFSEKVWPTIANKLPDARFRIVGRNPSSPVQRLRRQSVEVTGSVPSVIDHLAEAAVVVVPLRIGGGTRLKIYEAMAAGKAVVSTAVGVEGLQVNPGKDIWIADQPGDIANAVIRLVEDRELREKMGRAAAEQAAKFDWSAVAGSFRRSLMKARTERSAANMDQEFATPVFSGSSR